MANSIMDYFGRFRGVALSSMKGLIREQNAMVYEGHYQVGLIFDFANLHDPLVDYFTPIEINLSDFDSLIDLPYNFFGLQDKIDLPRAPKEILPSNHRRAHSQVSLQRKILNGRN